MHYKDVTITVLQGVARKFNREGSEPQLKRTIALLGRFWDDDAAFVAFKRELERTKITRRCRDLGPSFRGGWQ